MQSVTKSEARALVTAAAYTVGSDLGSRRYGDPEPLVDSDGEPRTVIHTVTGMLRGADLDLTEALARIQDADTVGWAPHIVGHDLIATKDGQSIRFDVQRANADALLAA